MGSLARKMARANKARKPGNAPQKAPRLQEAAVTDEGLYCDCHGTLYSYNVERDELLVDYLNAQYDCGRNVRLISTVPSQVYDKIAHIGLNPRILRTLNDKSLYYGSVLEELIDDDPVLLTARTHHKPDNEAFRAHMRAFLEQTRAAAAAPSSPKPV